MGTIALFSNKAKVAFADLVMGPYEKKKVVIDGVVSYQEIKVTKPTEEK